MKNLIFALALIAAPQVFAAPMTFDVSCSVEFTKTAPGEFLKTNSIEVFKAMQNHTSAKKTIGNLQMRIGVGSNVTTSEGEHGTMFSAAIADVRTAKIEDGRMGIAPFTGAYAEYEAADIGEKLKIDCSLLPSQL